MNKICEISAGDFFTQKIKVGQIAQHSWEYCKELSLGKKVLHIGCSDYPLFKPETNMHLHLSHFAKELHGCDTNGIDELRKHYNGVYFDEIFEVVCVNNEYDVILATNIIEHLENPGKMIERIFSIRFKKLFILVPHYAISAQAEYDGQTFTERIHPDHYCWYSPYTLWKLLSEQMKNIGAECEMNFFDNQNMISILVTNEK